MISSSVPTQCCKPQSKTPSQARLPGAGSVPSPYWNILDERHKRCSDGSRYHACRTGSGRANSRPTRRSHKLANTEVSRQSYVLVSLRLENGVIGYGEASTLGGPRWAEESVESIKSVIDTYLSPVLKGRCALKFEANAVIMAAAAQRNFAAKAALESAMLDAAGKTLGLPASAFLGGAVRTRFPVIWALASGDPVQEIEEARQKIAAREFNRFKIKIGFAEPAADIARLQALRSALGDGTLLVVDVNQGWSEATCLRRVGVVAETGQGRWSVCDEADCGHSFGGRDATLRRLPAGKQRGCGGASGLFCDPADARMGHRTFWAKDPDRGSGGARARLS